MNIIIASDSRGRGFPSFIHRFRPFPSHWQVSLICIPGAPIERLTNEVELLRQNLPEKSQSHVVFMAGICNLTKKIKHQFGSEVLYNPSPEKIQSLIQIIQNSFHILQNSNCSVKFSTIAPVSLCKFKDFQIRRHLLQRSNYSLEESNLQQNCLESDIREVNLLICELNLEHNVSNIRLDKDISKISCKKRGKNGKNKKKQVKFVYDNFYDGIHPDSDLADKWYSKICSSIKCDLENYEINLSLDSEEEMEEEVDDTWDFKRK